jgi:hydrogenase expression/formation protein HypE
MPYLERVVLGHGSGGKLSQDLITRLFLPPFANPVLNASDDAGVVELDGGLRLAVSTDSHVVWPLFFPGGDIGRLAVCGTVNDVAMMGATPLFLTAGFILEEGLDFQILERIVHSMQQAAVEANVQLIAGDTKVVQRGKADCLYINTTGLGLIPGGVTISGSNAQPGDRVLLSGSLGDHGIAVLSARGDLGFEASLQSDLAPLNRLVQAILKSAREYGSLSDVHVLRDPTRGGLATTLNEIARQSAAAIYILEDRLPVKPAVAAACELLGFDPLYIANEGKLVAIVAPEIAGPVLDAMQQAPYGEEAVQIGEVLASPAGRVLMKTTIGSTRVVETLAGELLPRIC